MMKKLFFTIILLSNVQITFGMNNNNNQPSIFNKIQAIGNVPRTPAENDRIDAKESAHQAKQRDTKKLLKSDSSAKKAAFKKSDFHKITKKNKFEKEELNLSDDSSDD